MIKIKNVNLDDRFCLRLREMGIVEGAKLKIANRGAFGSRVLAKGYERVAIDAKCAKCIEVEVEQTDRSTSTSDLSGGQ